MSKLEEDKIVTQLLPIATKMVEEVSHKIYYKILEAQGEKIYQHMTAQEQVKYIETIIKAEIALYSSSLCNALTEFLTKES